MKYQICESLSGISWCKRLNWGCMFWLSHNLLTDTGHHITRKKIESPSCRCSHTLPRMKFPTFSLLFAYFMAHIPYQFCMKLCEIIFTYREYIKILDTRGHGFLTIWFCLWSHITLFVLKNWVIFSTPSKTWNSLHCFFTFWHIPNPS